MRFTLTLVRSGNEDETEEQFDGTWVERAIPGKVMVSAYRQYDVTPEVIEKARKLGMYGAVERRLKKMARLAARITYPGANYRYQNYLFLIQHDKIVDILYFSDADRALYERRTYRERRAGLAQGETLPPTSSRAPMKLLDDDSKELVTKPARKVSPTKDHAPLSYSQEYARRQKQKND